MTVDHHDFTITRTLPHTPAQVFDAWADPAKKAKWYADAPDFSEEQITYDFRVGGREYESATHAGGVRHTMESEYTNIVPNERIVFTYSMTLDDKPLSTSLTCVTFEALDGGTLMTFTEHGVHLDGIDTGEQREEGWHGILDRFVNAVAEIYVA